MQQHLRRLGASFFAAASLLALNTEAWEPVHLTPYPQKVCSFFGLNAPNLPSGLSTNASPLPLGGITVATRATDNSVWLGTTQGVMRLDFSAPDRDRYQY